MKFITEYLNEGKKTALELITDYLDPYTVINDGESINLQIDGETVIAKKYAVVCSKKSDIKDILKRIKELYVARENNGINKKVGDESFDSMQNMYEKEWDEDPADEKSRVIYISFYLF